MGIFPKLNPDLQGQLDQLSKPTTDTKSLGKTYLFDFIQGDFTIRDGKLVEVTGQEALKGWIEKVVRTQKNKYQIYEGNYGVNIEDLLYNNGYSVNFVNSELKREITEALSRNPMIKTVDIADITREGVNLTITVNVNGSEVKVSV